MSQNISSNLLESLSGLPSANNANAKINSVNGHIFSHLPHREDGKEEKSFLTHFTKKTSDGECELAGQVSKDDIDLLNDGERASLSVHHPSVDVVANDQQGLDCSISPVFASQGGDPTQKEMHPPVEGAHACMRVGSNFYANTSSAINSDSVTHTASYFPNNQRLRMTSLLSDIKMSTNDVVLPNTQSEHKTINHFSSRLNVTSSTGLTNAGETATDTTSLLDDNSVGKWRDDKFIDVDRFALFAKPLTAESFNQKMPTLSNQYATSESFVSTLKTSVHDLTLNIKDLSEKMSVGDKSDIKITMRPTLLGEVKVELAKHDSELKILIVASTDEVSNHLNLHKSELVNAIKDTSVSVDVSTSQGDPRRQLAHQKKKRGDILRTRQQENTDIQDERCQTKVNLHS